MYLCLLKEGKFLTKLPSLNKPLPGSIIKFKYKILRFSVHVTTIIKENIYAYLEPEP